MAAEALLALVLAVAGGRSLMDRRTAAMWDGRTLRANLLGSYWRFLACDLLAVADRLLLVSRPWKFELQRTNGFRNGIEKFQLLD